MKPIWMPIIFLAGLGAGMLLDRSRGHDTPASADPPGLAPPKRSAASIRPEATTGIAMSPSIAVRTPAVADPAPTRAIPVSGEPSTEAPATAEESAPAQPIDVGPAFRQQFDVNRKHGYHDQAAEMHAALEREPRDDSWSYPLEADIQNSLLADTTAGNFKAEHVECRTSMCEIRLSASDPQQAKALERWMQGNHLQTWASQINVSSVLTISDGAHTDTLMVLTRPNAAQPH